MRNAQTATQAEYTFYSAEYHVQCRDAGVFARLKPAARDTLIALIHRANRQGHAWPAVETIARDYGLGASSVREAFAQLQREGLIVEVLDDSTYGRKTRTWRLLPPKVVSLNPGGHPSNRRRHPSEARRATLRASEPIMSGDQTMDHANEPTKQQQPDPSMRAHEPEPAHEASGGAAAAILATPPPGEPPAPSSPAASESESIDQADATVQLAQGLRERLRAAGVEPLKAAAYHPDIVALALDRVVARQARSYVSNPTGLFLHILADPELAAALPKPSPQLQLPLAAAAAAENAEQNGPLKTTRWARSRDGGPALEVLEANPVRVQLAGGVAVPAWAWQRWEWFDEKPVDQVEHQVDEELPPAVPVDQKRQVDLARINTSVAIRGIDHFSVAASLKAAGLTLEDLEAYRATLHLQGGTP